MRGRPRRRWLRRLVASVAAAVLLVMAVYAWAWASVDRSSIARAMWWGEADVGDQYRFPARTIPAGDVANPLPVGIEIDLSSIPLAAGGSGGTFDGFLRGTDTLAFVVVDDDELVYERYLNGADPQARQTSFSVAKSFLSTLVGIATDEGLIGSVADPVTEYLPELADRDPRFEQITLRDLLTMSSGIRYREQPLPLPWGDDVNTYYGTNLRKLALNATEIKRPPGQEWLYNNYNPLLLGMVLERATGMSVSEYMATKLWQPLGAERDATWSLDSEASGFEKMESGLNAAPVDYARFRPAVPARRRVERHAHRLSGLGACRHRRRYERRPCGGLSVLLVDRYKEDRALLRARELRAVHLCCPRCGGRHRSERSRLGRGKPHVAERVP